MATRMNAKLKKIFLGLGSHLACQAFGFSHRIPLSVGPFWCCQFQGFINIALFGVADGPALQRDRPV